MSPDVQLALEYAAFVAVIIVVLWAITRAGTVHHCDKCKEWWEAQQGAEILGGLIVELDENKETATVRMETGELAKCNMAFLRAVCRDAQRGPQFVSPPHV